MNTFAGSPTRHCYAKRVLRIFESLLEASAPNAQNSLPFLSLSFSARLSACQAVRAFS